MTTAGSGGVAVISTGFSSSIGGISVLSGDDERSTTVKIGAGSSVSVGGTGDELRTDSFDVGSSSLRLEVRAGVKSNVSSIIGDWITEISSLIDKFSLGGFSTLTDDERDNFSR